MAAKTGAMKGKIYKIQCSYNPIKEVILMREQDRHFLWSLYAAVGVIFLWKGLWDGLYEIPYIGNPFVALFIGLAILTFSGIIFSEFDPLGGVEKAVKKRLYFVHSHPKKHQFSIKYHDKKRKKDFDINAKLLKTIEKKALVLKHEEKNQEWFVPLHRIKEITHLGKTYWRM